ncbi:hypothetical protein TKK_0009256 [Trichogramma kaykai]|uniref:DNA/RNA non-specific endonuclease/pyrophosphatase/phosphodiesterase domain-containing protein n=1 Tax=Trichogramma kaykai TaxID=54128 RepID=A0ABD2X2T0_9HYME
MWSSAVWLWLLGYFALPAHATFCWVDVTEDFHKNAPLLLKYTTNEVVYPDTAKSDSVRFSFGERVRVACPRVNVTVFGSSIKSSEVPLKCYAISFFDVVGTNYVAPFGRISCSEPAQAVARADPNEICPEGRIGRIGFSLRNEAFLPTIERICFNQLENRPSWAKSTVTTALRSRRASVRKPLYRKGEFYENVEIGPETFSIEEQRTRFKALLKKDELVDKYLAIGPKKPALRRKSKKYARQAVETTTSTTTTTTTTTLPSTSTTTMSPTSTTSKPATAAAAAATASNWLVEGQLVPASDMYYKSQQNSTYFYINTLPVWKSIEEGNWKLVEEIVRSTAGQLAVNLDAWTGGLDNLRYPDADGKEVELSLLRDGSLTVPRYLYKYVHDPVHNYGLVFVTMNDPYLGMMTADDHLCSPLDACQAKYPQFKDATKGYTYCCAIDSSSDFALIVADLGVPTFPSARPFFS